MCKSSVACQKSCRRQMDGSQRFLFKVHACVCVCVGDTWFVSFFWGVGRGRNGGVTWACACACSRAKS